MAQLPPRYQFFTGIKNKYKWKLFIAKPPQSNSTQPFTFPFLDICFYNENKTYISDIDLSMARSQYEKSSVFPLVLRPFYHLWLPAPKDTAEVIRQEFNGTENMCKLHLWNHKINKVLLFHEVSVPCTELCSYFPCVNRTQTSSGHLESLVIGEDTIYSLETK